MIRLASAADAFDIAAIYHPIVTSTPISFEITPPDAAEIAERIQKKHPNFPWIVFESNQRVVGYAYAGPHRSRAAYQWSVETSVYVHENYHRKGIAKKLYTCLLDLLKMQGFQMAYAGIVLPNEASEGFHQSLGFKSIGIYDNVGFKQGRWHSVSWSGLALNVPQSIPPQPLHLDQISKEALNQIFERYC